MKTSIDILDAVSRAHGDCTDYRIAKITGISPATISSIRAGRCALSRANCKRAALALGVEAGALIAITQAEREDDPEIRESLLRVARRALAAAAVVAAVGLGAPSGQVAQAATGPQEAGANCLLCKIPRRRSRQTLRLPGRAGLLPRHQPLAGFLSSRV